MTKTGRAVVWTSVGVGGLVLAGIVWAKESPTTFPLKFLLPKSGTSSTSGVSLAVSGYILGTTGTGTPTSSVHIASTGDAVTGVSVVSLSSKVAALAIGLRAWIVQLGANMDPSRFLTVGAYSGTVEGHLFGSPSSTTVLVDHLSFQPGQHQQEMLFSQPLDPAGIAWQNPAAPSQALGVVWAAGPYADVAALPDESGTIPTGGSVAYAVSQNAIIYP